MKVLLDECVPRRLTAHLSGHDVKTVPQAGWAGVKNGSLLKLAAVEFDVFITVDRNLSFQQDVKRLEIAVVVIAAKSNRYQDILPLAPQILKVLDGIRRGEVITVGFDARDQTPA